MGLERTKNVTLSFALFIAVAFTSVLDAAQLPRIDPKTIISKFGKPDEILSTEYDRPRPPMVTRLYTYRRARVQFALLADAPPGTAPPYDRWLLIGIVDPVSKKS